MDAQRIELDDLEGHAAELLDAAEAGAEWTVCRHGEPVATLRKLEADSAQRPSRKLQLDQILEIARELSQNGPPGLSAVDQLLADRRERDEVLRGISGRTGQHSAAGSDPSGPGVDS